MIRSLLLSALAACLALPSAALAEGDATRGEALYEGCQDCHSLDKNEVGPRHRGVYGRKAGSLPDYSYSDGLKNSTVGLGRPHARPMADGPAKIPARRENVLSSR